MTGLTATYRLQFRNGFDFETAIPVVRYLARLGVSHLYASPIFQARSGSTHGYDVTDHHRLDDSLGGRDGFRQLCAELRALGLGLILDIVPNHMAASPENPWWRDVLRKGKASRYSGYFDIDWSRERPLLPLLGQRFEDALAAGELGFGLDAEGPALRYFDHMLPLDPESWPLLLDGFGEIDPAGFPAWSAEERNRTTLSEHLARLSKDNALVERVHAAQHYLLAPWRSARDELGYRRFFEISDLVGVRVEEDEVFDDVHAFIFELVEEGVVDGLRVDHVDGLADPAKYLSDLQRKLPRPVPVWIEKILAGDEGLPPTWLTVGATGYEFAAAACRLLTNGNGIGALDSAYRSYAGVTESYDALVAEAKVEILTRNLAAELNILVRFAAAALGDGVDQQQLRAGIVALMSALPVYRTYFTTNDAPEADLEILAGAVALARRQAEEDQAIVDTLADLLRGGDPQAERFRTRFQQTSAALQAKAVEDTVFYRFNRLLSANEVGADPGVPSMSVPEFHDCMRLRAARGAAQLSATATHDTKRGEDARMRIAAISEAPEDWTACVRRFDELLGPLCAHCDPNMRWLFYQSLLGAWTGPADDGLKDRMGAFLLKAAREAKQRTSWVDGDEGYEAGLATFVEGVLSDTDFMTAFGEAAASFIRTGERKSLVQLGLKLFAPGVPDVYQGTEFADLSLVDPDNRRAVDFETRLPALEDGAALSAFDRRKMELLRFGLNARRQWPELFQSDYCALSASAGAIAFSRTHAQRALYFAAALSGVDSASLPQVDDPIIAVYPQAGDNAGITIAIVDSFSRGKRN